VPRRTRTTVRGGKFANQEEVLGAIQHYYGRYLAAAEYQKHKKLEADSRNEMA
jgi:hypothetical protein